MADFDKALEIDPTDQPTRRSRGDARRLRKDYAGAVADFNIALQQDPNDPIAYENRGQVKCDNGDFEGAIADSKKAIQLNPKSAIAYNNLGLIAEKRGQLDEALAKYTKAIEANSKLDFAYVNRGNTRWENHEPDAAIADYDRAIEINPKLASAYVRRAVVKQAKGDLDGAMADRNRAFEAPGKRDTPLFLSPPANPKSKINPKSAIGSDLPKLDSVIPSLITSNISPEQLNAVAHRAYKNGDFDRAIQLDNEMLAITKTGDNAYKALLNRGNSQLAKKQLPEAMRDFTDAIPIDPDFCDAYLRRAIVYSQMKKYGEATADLETVSKLTGNEPPSGINSHGTAALRGLNSAARIWATNPDPKLRDANRAVKEATRACELSHWQQRNFVDTLAAAYAEKGNFDEAMKYEQQVIDMHGTITFSSQQLQERLDLYKGHKAYREDPAATER